VNKVSELTKFILLAIAGLDDPEVKSCIAIMNPRSVVKATWRLKPKARDRRREILLTIGEPDYKVAQFIKKESKKSDRPLYGYILRRKFPAKKK